MVIVKQLVTLVKDRRRIRIRKRRDRQKVEDCFEVNKRARMYPGLKADALFWMDDADRCRGAEYEIDGKLMYFCRS